MAIENKALRAATVVSLLVLLSPGVAAAEDPLRCENSRCEGTEGNDTIVASSGSERVVGLAGDDDIELDEAIAVGGDDVGMGGLGQDCIDGGAGADLMIGGPGDDNRPCAFTAFVNPRAALTSGPGDDRVEGRQGDDSMDGIADDDTLLGNRGEDLIEDRQTDDSDRLFGGRGRDVLDATDADGDDLIVGGPGEDECSGDEGDVFVSCESGT
jgi:hypothetical protein